MSGKTINLGRALGFNTLTTGLAAGGFAYTEEKFGDAGLPPLIFVGLILAFAAAFVFGVLVAGEAASFGENAKDVEEAKSKALFNLGKAHSVFLLIGLAGLALLFIQSAFSPKPEPTICETILELGEDKRAKIKHDCDAIHEISYMTVETRISHA